MKIKERNPEEIREIHRDIDSMVSIFGMEKYEAAGFLLAAGAHYAKESALSVADAQEVLKTVWPEV